MLVIGADTAALDGALRTAQLLARRDRVNAHVVAIVPPLAARVPGLGDADLRALDDGRRQQHLVALRQHVHRTIGRSAHFSTGSEIGTADDAIERVARARRSALILSGLAPRGTPQRGPAEQLALRAARAAGVPVLAVPVNAALLPQRSLVAMDFGPASIRAAHAALATTGQGGVMTLAHVAEPGTTGSDDAGEAFGRLLSALGAPAGVAVDTVILEGEPTSALLRLALAGDYDLIAAGSRTTSRSEFRMAGSVTLGLLRGAMGAVLVAPPETQPSPSITSLTSS
jgi:nucleotide-binding universal stress UspA family protein